MKFTWKFCELCDTQAVICPKCGNNCCNGSYGGDNMDCDICPLAYQYQQLAWYHHDVPEKDSLELIKIPEWLQEISI